VRVAIVHNFHDGAVPSGEDATVEAERDSLERAGFDVEVIAARNDALATGPLGSARAAATVVTGIGVSPLARLRRWEPDVVHVHNLFPFIGRTWLTRVEVPIVTTMHSYRSICANGYLFRDGAICTRCPEGHPWAGVRYGCYRKSRAASLPHAISARRGAKGDPLLAASTAVLVLSERARAVMTAAGVPSGKLRPDHHFIPDALDPGLTGEPDGSWVFAGRLSPEKGIDRLVAEWPDDEPLRILGDGELRAAVESSAKGKRIELMGNRSRSEVLSTIRSSFGLVFPSRWYETFGLTYIEALAAGVPTLAFAPNVVADAVTRDSTGMVAEWGAVPRAVRDARERFDALRAHCRQVFEDRYTETGFVSRRTALYDEVTA
jgi:glycosyltransferase involved in cell wall biosynthesis